MHVILLVSKHASRLGHYVCVSCCRTLHVVFNTVALSQTIALLIAPFTLENVSFNVDRMRSPAIGDLTNSHRMEIGINTMKTLLLVDIEVVVSRTVALLISSFKL